MRGACTKVRFVSRCCKRTFKWTLCARNRRPPVPEAACSALQTCCGTATTTSRRKRRRYRPEWRGAARLRISRSERALLGASSAPRPEVRRRPLGGRGRGPRQPQADTEGQEGVRPRHPPQAAQAGAQEAGVAGPQAAHHLSKAAGLVAAAAAVIPEKRAGRGLFSKKKKRRFATFCDSFAGLDAPNSKFRPPSSEFRCSFAGLGAPNSKFRPPSSEFRGAVCDRWSQYA